MQALDETADEKLTGLALRLVLSDYVDIPHETQVDLLTDAAHAFASAKPKATKARTAAKPKPSMVKSTPKKEASRKKAA